MNKKSLFLPLAVALIAAAGSSLASCNKNSDKSVWEDYAAWRNSNLEYLLEQQELKQPDGSPYFTSYVPNWDKSSFVLIHFYNDTMLTKDNLKPLSNSTVDVKYHLSLMNGAAIDSSYLLTTYGDGVYRTRLDAVIPGWTAALTQMHVGDSTRILIPYHLGYGSSVSAAVPPYSTLVFDVKLVDIPYYEASPY